MTPDKKPHKHFYVAIIILTVASTTSWAYFRTVAADISVNETIPLRESLRTIPMELDQWECKREGALRADVELKVGTKDWLLRAYRKGKDRKPLNVYIAYFEGIRGMAPHSPDVCRPSSGGILVSSSIEDLQFKTDSTDPNDEEMTTVRVHWDVYEQNKQTEVVVWWEYIHGENIASLWRQRLKWALPKFLGGKVGSILQVQISVAVDGNEEACRSDIVDFLNHLGPHLKRVLPRSSDEEVQESKLRTLKSIDL